MEKATFDWHKEWPEQKEASGESVGGGDCDDDDGDAEFINGWIISLIFLSTHDFDVQRPVLVPFPRSRSVRRANHLKRVRNPMLGCHRNASIKVRIRTLRGRSTIVSVAGPFEFGGFTSRRCSVSAFVYLRAPAISRLLSASAFYPVSVYILSLAVVDAPIIVITLHHSSDRTRTVHHRPVVNATAIENDRRGPEVWRVRRSFALVACRSLFQRSLVRYPF
jgi:hypothetical protein